MLFAGLSRLRFKCTFIISNIYINICTILIANHCHEVLSYFNITVECAFDNKAM